MDGNCRQANGALILCSHAWEAATSLTLRQAVQAGRCSQCSMAGAACYCHLPRWPHLPLDMLVIFLANGVLEEREAAVLAKQLRLLSRGLGRRGKSSVGGSLPQRVINSWLTLSSPSKPRQQEMGTFSFREVSTKDSNHFKPV